MIARIFTRLFYAVIFFGLGVWAAPQLDVVGRTIDQGVAAVSDGAAWLWALAEESISTTPAPTQTAAPVPVPAPKPAATVAAKPAEPATVKPAATPESKPAAAPAESKPTATATATGAKPPITVDTVAEARAAYGRGDVAGAIRAYEAAAAIAPNDPAITGELGNVLWANGRMAEAAKAFHRAGLALVAAGRIAEAQALVEPIGKSNADLAADLSRALAKGR